MVLERGGGFLRAWHKRSARDLDEAQAVCEAIDRALRDWKMNKIVFDSRDADTSPKDVGDHIWNWLATHEGIAGVATLVESEALAIAINMGGVGKGVRIRAFHREEPAIRWLTLLT